jgi:hypothetical protein
MLSTDLSRRAGLVVLEDKGEELEEGVRESEVQ